MTEKIITLFIIAALIAVIVHSNYRLVDMVERSHGCVAPISMEELR